MTGPMVFGQENNELDGLIMVLIRYETPSKIVFVRAVTPILCAEVMLYWGERVRRRDSRWVESSNK